MIEKLTQIDRLEILEDGHIQVREITTFVENGIEIGKGEYHRHVVSPIDDITKEDTQVQAVAVAVRTRAVVDAYKAKLDASFRQGTVAPVKLL